MPGPMSVPPFVEPLGLLHGANAAAAIAAGVALPLAGTAAGFSLVRLIGADRICLGSDHGAVRFDIPGFEDCTKWPVVTQALKDHGFSDIDVRNILGDNVLRLMERVVGS